MFDDGGLLSELGACQKERLKKTFLYGFLSKGQLNPIITH